MLSKKMLAELNKQVGEELGSAYIYLSMSMWFETKNLRGMAGWMKKQFEEEVEHAEKFMDYINTRFGAVKLEAIGAPKHEWKSPLDAFETAYKHECHISACIHKLVDLARAEGDKATENFLQWFVEEQVEEEENTMNAVEMLKMAGDHVPALMMLDQIFGKRED
ncbi:MAG: ferritin [bacterium]|jgi:ferritin